MTTSKKKGPGKKGWKKKKGGIPQPGVWLLTQSKLSEGEHDGMVCTCTLIPVQGGVSPPQSDRSSNNKFIWGSKKEEKKTR